MQNSSSSPTLAVLLAQLTENPVPEPRIGLSCVQSPQPFDFPMSPSANQFSLLSPEQVNRQLLQSLQNVTESMNRLDQQIKMVCKKQKALSLPFKIRKARQEEECCICQQTIPIGNNTVKLNCRCKHTQHIKCITLWLKNNHSCPLCRKRFRVSDESFLRYE